MSLRLALAILLIAAGTASVVWYMWPQDVGELIENTSTTAQHTLEQAGDILRFDRTVITPPPLHGPRTGHLATLTNDGVFQFTNQQRQQNNVSTLTRNPTLDAAAANKMQDMFARQYFEHISPTGEGPADVVDGVNYSYIRVGENLALGNFPSDEALVQAWMDSPGHRANILDEGFQEIGIAVGRGVFEGEETWIGVQTFATPSSECNVPNSALTNTIEANKQRLEHLEQELTQLQARIEQLAHQGNTKVEQGNQEIERGNNTYQETGDEDAARVHWEAGEALQAEGKALHTQAQTLEAEYNSAINDIKLLLEQTQGLVDTYNTQVRAFNACVESFS